MQLFLKFKNLIKQMLPLAQCFTITKKLNLYWLHRFVPKPKGRFTTLCGEKFDERQIIVYGGAACEIAGIWNCPIGAGWKQWAPPFTTHQHPIHAGERSHPATRSSKPNRRVNNIFLWCVHLCFPNFLSPTTFLCRGTHFRKHWCTH